MILGRGERGGEGKDRGGREGRIEGGEGQAEGKDRGRRRIEGGEGWRGRGMIGGRNEE